MYLQSITNFRAIAIILIVGAHCYGISDFIQNDFLTRLVFNITSGGTIIFVFLSGFLFHHIFYLKGRINIFLKNRAKRLLIPYLILSIIPILYRIYFEPEFWSNIIPTDRTGFFYEFVYPYFLFLISGDHLVAYWYIPFAMLLFSLYPLHSLFIKGGIKNQVIIMLITLIVSLIVQRPLPKSLLFVQSLVYLTPAYLFGIFCSINKNLIYAKFKGKDYIFLLFFLGILLTQTLLGIKGNTHKAFFAFEGIDTVLPQKILLCLFLLIWLHRFENYSNKYINTLANVSFAVYFIHGYVLRILYLLKDYFGIREFNYPFVTFIASIAILIIASIGVAVLLKKVLKSNSVYITGY